jgi:hypothetical protein
MKFRINKAKLSVIILSILMVTSIAMITLPVQAQLAANQPVSGPMPSGVTAEKYDTICCLSFTPNPIGIRQTLLVNMWICPAITTQRLLPQAFRVTITKPDGTTDVQTLDSEPATAAQWFQYIPDQLGTWKFKVEFLGTYFPAGMYYNGKVVTNSSGTQLDAAYYNPSSTKEQTLTVQQDMVWSWPPAPLPTDYWTRPANINNREWWPILGNYPGTGYQGGGPMWDSLYPNTNPCYSTNYGFHPWVQGPNSAHIVWKRQGAIAGIIGGPAGQYGITSNPGNPSVVYAGRCYQTITETNGSSYAECYDLRTGQIYYKISTTEGGVTPSYVSYVNPVQGSTILSQDIASSTWSVELLSISGSQLMKINPWTGALAGNYSIAPLTMAGGTQAPGGGIFYNQIGGYCLTLQDLGATANPRYAMINWTTRGSGNLASRIVSNTTITWPLGIGIGGFTVNTNNAQNGGSIHVDFNLGIAGFVGKNESPLTGVMMGTNVSAFSMKTGRMLWTTYLPDISTYSPMVVVADHGKIAFQVQQGGYFLAYDLVTGALAWKSELPDYPWSTNAFGAYAIQSAYGMLFRDSYDGVYAFNWTNGKIVWHYEAHTLAHFESPYIDNGTEVYSFNAGGMIADGKMYVYNTEHTPSWPMTRGWSLHCINITTGEPVWKIDNPMVQGAIADGYLTAGNSYDGYMYVFGKGHSATTVMASPKTIADGAPVLIEGTVMDLSPAQPNTPCVSKDSMETQMEYLHLQQQIDGLYGNETITGVPVTLQAIASDNSVIDIGTATTNGYYGTFEMAWTPPATGTYLIIATFAGDDSYSSSGASTGLLVGPAPATPTPVVTSAPINAASPTDLMTYIVGVGIAIIIAIAIATVLILRKH